MRDLVDMDEGRQQEAKGTRNSGDQGVGGMGEPKPVRYLCVRHGMTKRSFYAKQDAKGCSEHGGVAVD